MSTLQAPRGFLVLVGRSMAGAILLFAAHSATAQLGELISPGPLTRAHAKLEGIEQCQSCHEKGQKVSATRCLACHKDVGARMKARKGVHRDVTGDCESCHVEHMGRDAELRPFDAASFDHRAETGFPLDGSHSQIARQCEKCHKTRSFLTARSECASCHNDVHKGTMGQNCIRCHSVAIPFRQTATQFDHSRAAFPLEGAHRVVACEKCHQNKVFKPVKHQACTDCHRNPHKQSLGTDCRSCHGMNGWKVQTFDHSKTGMPLLGKHLSVACAKCHVKPATQVRLQSGSCANCHADPHKGQFREDCRACHNETGFKKARFDHLARTGLALDGKHAALACAACHKTAKGASPARDFRGLSRQCSTCHTDPHAGQLGRECESCHRTASSFKVAAFEHPRFPEFFAGQHAHVTCEQCHKTEPAARGSKTPAAARRVYKNLSTNCSSCHRDVHLGQLPQCSDCHTVDAPKFAPTLFQHTRTNFPLAGKHANVACNNCHKPETATFPGGVGSAVRFRGLSSQCSSCHRDVHLGQVGTECARCHTTNSFAVPQYLHRNQTTFFRGRHAALQCSQCHRQMEADFPSGHGVAVRLTGFREGCAGCHEDVHRGQLGAACESCHQVDAAWRNASRAFHKQGRFPLEGRHLEVACASCHWNGVTRGTPTTCYDCHWVRRQDDRYATRLGIQCEQCHRPTSWTAVEWSHAAQTGFPLNTPHRQLACDQCHVGQVFNAARSECSGCHMGHYRSAKSPDHQNAGFPLQCQVCHTAAHDDWHQAQFSHATFTLAGVHQSQRCESCHRNNVYQGTARTCAGCHQEDYAAARDPNHAAAGFASTCESCHAFADASWDQGRFNHAKWPLVGRHNSPQCAQCHASSVYTGLRSDCLSCHQRDYDSAVNPPHAQSGFPTACQQCHGAADPTWHSARFDHTTFPLAGAHATQPCASCHSNGVYRGTATTCLGCHQQDYDASKNPDHRAIGFPTNCDGCHRFADASWAEGRFDHSTFVLAGAHQSPPCSACHLNNVYQGTPRACAGCHRTAYDQATNPHHAPAGFNTGCEQCHGFTDASWQQGRYVHSSWPLLGAHNGRECTSCHASGVYRGRDIVCASCHQQDYDQTANPPHSASGFPLICDSCHAVGDPDWHVARFDHQIFPLAGRHLSSTCTDCHGNGVYRGTPRLCAGCHQDEYNQTQNPNHLVAGFPTICDGCHRFADASWDLATFDHTTFPLAGAHLNPPCSACHVNGVYAGTSRLCYGCHREDYEQANDPNHVTTGFPTICDSCHRFGDSSWDQGVFTHSTFTLAGVHATRPCGDCHINGVYAGTPRACYGCHRTEYEQTSDPNHMQAGFPASCEACHRYTDSSWDQATFAHDTFPLQGAHTNRSCADCHINGVYAGTPRTCYACHRSDYEQATNPNHVQAGFSTSCESCHRFSDTSWDQGTFSHSTFPLQGAHANRPCGDCHVNGVYAGTPRNCYGCHRSDYEQASNPNHLASGFPTTCEVCHRFSDASWDQGVFNHTWFPITSGPHAQRECVECHPAQGDFRIFTCTNCHTQADTDPDHDEVNGYRYDSVACYACHPNGRH